MTPEEKRKMNGEIKQVERRSSCRLCGKALIPGAEKIFRCYSHANRGTTVLLCFDCVDYISELKRNEEE